MRQRGPNTTGLWANDHVLVPHQFLTLSAKKKKKKLEKFSMSTFLTHQFLTLSAKKKNEAKSNSLGKKFLCSHYLPVSLTSF
jgi:hypothetical protein